MKNETHICNCGLCPIKTIQYSKDNPNDHYQGFRFNNLDTKTKKYVDTEIVKTFIKEFPKIMERMEQYNQLGQSSKTASETIADFGKCYSSTK